MDRTTERDSLYDNLEKKSTREILEDINREDKKVALAVENEMDSIEKLVNVVHSQMSQGGRLFYLGAGTSGRLGVVDASECPPTFGVPHDWVVGLIAGGDSAIRKAVEFAEDSTTQGWKDLKEYEIGHDDVVVGIAASGTTPYVVHALIKCREEGIKTGCIVCNQGSPIAANSDHPIEVVVGPEYVTGSTRMKSGTAQKLVLNMLTTSVMIKLGRVVGNKMVDMQLSNNKLVDRGTKVIQKATGLTYEDCKKVLLSEGSIRKALKFLKK